MKTLSLTLVAAALALALPASAESVAPLTWTACGPALGAPADVAARTECARLPVPRDYADPSAGMLTLDVVRVVADHGRGERHDGSVFLEPDEFDDDTGRSVTAMASAWRDGDGSWIDVARRLDLVGLAQRRMDDAGGHDCLTATAALPRHASLGTDAGDAALDTAEALALAIATACRNDPMHAHIGMEPRLRDLERLREALGQETWHLYGAGRGGWVAARYASRHPRHVDRMLLDGTWDVDGSVAEAMELRIAERGRALRRAIAALADEPLRFDVGSADVHARIARLPSALHAAWAPRIVDVHHLVAVLAMGRLLDGDPSLSPAMLRAALATARVGTTDDDDRAVREAAASLLAGATARDPYGFGPRAAGAAPAVVASVFATRCNDGYWGKDPGYWRQVTREMREAWPSSVGDELVQGMVCSQWPGAFGPSWLPTLQRPFLMVHAEFDGDAPLRGAALTMQTHGQAKLVVARGLRAQAVATRHDLPCVSTAAGRYLADGVLPTAALTNCAPPATPPSS